MGDKSAKYRKLLGWVIWTVWTALVVGALIPAGQATSNLQSWANLFGLPHLGQYLAGKGSDYIVLFLALLSVMRQLGNIKRAWDETMRLVRKALLPPDR